MQKHLIHLNIDIYDTEPTLKHLNTDLNAKQSQINKKLLITIIN